MTWFKPLCLAAAIVSTTAWASDWPAGSTHWGQLPDVKVSKAGLYLTPQQALDMKQNAPQKVALFDVRTRAEAMYVGMASAADALVPYMEHQEIMLDWDDKRGMYKLEPNADFEPEIERRLKAMGLGKTDPIVLICRSGDRSSKAADRLLLSGYTQVYSVAEGFEGDTAKDGARKGQRVVNGWQNAQLPWSYKLDKAKAYFPR